MPISLQRYDGSGERLSFAVPLCGNSPRWRDSTASRQLLSVDGTEQPVIFISSAIVQILLEDFENVFIQGDNQRLAVLCGVDIDNRVIKVYVFDLDIDQTVLPNAGRKQEVDNHPTAIRREDALMDIRLSQELAQFFIRVCLDRRFGPLLVAEYQTVGYTSVS